MKWSGRQKEAAREAFELARGREYRAVREEVEKLSGGAGADDEVVWRVHEFLRERLREMGEKYDYRYSRLMLVFGRLVAEGWLRVEELAGIGEEKVEWIVKLREIRR